MWLPHMSNQNSSKQNVMLHQLAEARHEVSHAVHLHDHAHPAQGCLSQQAACGCLIGPIS